MKLLSYWEWSHPWNSRLKTEEVWILIFIYVKC